jgi:hypothetical protein
MNDQPLIGPGNLKNTDRVIIRDPQHQEVKQIETREVVVTEPDGSERTLQVTEELVTVDGVVWDLSMYRSGSAPNLSVCNTCRFPPRRWWLWRPRSCHGLVTSNNAKLCATCGAIVCPGHRACGADGLFRCPPCDHAERWRQFWRKIFYARS